MIKQQRCRLNHWEASACPISNWSHASSEGSRSMRGLSWHLWLHSQWPDFYLSTLDPLFKLLKGMPRTTESRTEVRSAGNAPLLLDESRSFRAASCLQASKRFFLFLGTSALTKLEFRYNESQRRHGALDKPDEQASLTQLGTEIKARKDKVNGKRVRVSEEEEKLRTKKIRRGETHQ